ncbi:MAG: ribonucleotide reductase N-terminal alpha domain-containing protein [Bacillota bacterium]
MSEGIGSPEKAGFTDNALAVLEKRYLRKDGSGKVIETAYEMFWRVAKNIALMDVLYYPGISAQGEAPGGPGRHGSPGRPKGQDQANIPGQQMAQ